MKATKEAMMKEAVNRMNILGVAKETIRQFTEDGKLTQSEPPIGGLYWVDDDTLADVRKFEEEYKSLVYLVVRSFTNIGIMDSYLFVPEDTSTWKEDVAILKKEGYIFSYVRNLDYPECSEFGDVWLKRTPAAGILRVG